MAGFNQSDSVDPNRLDGCTFSFVSGFTSTTHLSHETLFLKEKINSEQMSVISSLSKKVNQVVGCCFEASQQERSGMHLFPSYALRGLKLDLSS